MKDNVIEATLVTRIDGILGGVKQIIAGSNLKYIIPLPAKEN